MATIDRPDAVYVGVSTKMYLGYERSLAWLEGLRRELLARGEGTPRTTADGAPGTTASGGMDAIPFAAPSYPVLESAARILDGTGCRLAAQNCAVGDGAATGEVSAGMLAELGVRIVEIGHAERRADFGEDDAVVAAKVRSATAAGLTPLLCVGELRRGGPGEAAADCLRQIAAALGTGTEAGTDPASVLFAYEPVWAIGATEPASPAHVNAVLALVRERLTVPGRPVTLIYGGSAGPGLLPRLPEADGLFLGRFAHDPANFGAVLDEARARRPRLETT
ncbi:triose-phosphate isomerase family protein [Zhihengliuella salsuginis]|uniref:Triosephosphate isomerase n=1 Tax=Zhihengliuella salsuginis TaxID=578222 RepID=A0ABQ3GA15_9MICC|nr:triose-phosphate isomerase family protein [Zhihengliuella salsuginis]GHC99126.1 triosephosphate isomerase [Zhihengliuella salsuginis]